MTTRRGRGRGGRGGHEAPLAVRNREQRAMQLAAQGATQTEIARDLGISQPAVSKLLRRVEVRVFNETVRARGGHKARVMLRLEFLFRESLHAWERSKADTTRRRQRKVLGATGSGGSIAEVVVENQHGDPRYLEQARKALADATKLWGLDLPPLNKLTPRATPAFDQMSPKELLEHVAQRYTQVMRRLEALDAQEAELADAWTEDKTAARSASDSPQRGPDGQ